jgi:alpha-beta hydrolase superfamily lysophospholipase
VLDPPALGALAVPVLAVHGDRDRVTPPEEAEALFVHARDAETVLVVDGRHDILNDVSHRSVAAEIVQFLERLRIPGAEPILRRRDAVGSDLVDRVG